MLKGKRIDVRRMEREDLALANEWFNDPAFRGLYGGYPRQRLRSEREKDLFDPKLADSEFTPFVVQKKDGSAIGWAFHEKVLPYEWVNIGYHLIPGERGWDMGPSWSNSWSIISS